MSPAPPFKRRPQMRSALDTTGPAGVGRDLIRASAESLDDTTLATVGLVIVVLLLVYRSPLLALVPLVTIAVSSWVALKLLALVTLMPGVHLVNISQIFAIVILYGAGTDYCLFLISRYREELEHGQPLTAGAAARRSGPSAGAGGQRRHGHLRPGPDGLRRVRQGALRRAGHRPEPGRRSGRVADADAGAVAARRPGRVLAPAACHTALSAERPDDLWDRHQPRRRRPAGLGVRRGAGPAGAAGGARPPGDADLLAHRRAVAVVAERPGAGGHPAALHRRRDRAAHRAARVRHRLGRGRRPGVARAPQPRLRPPGQRRRGPQPDAAARRAVARAVGGRPGGGVCSPASCTGPARPASSSTPCAAKQHYVGTCPEGDGPRHVTRLDVVLRSDPFEPESAETLETIETWLRDLLPERTREIGPVQAECYGVTVTRRDLAGDRERPRPRQRAGAGRHLPDPAGAGAQALAGGVPAGDGAAELLRHAGATTVLATVWGGKPLGEVDWRVPFFLFTILVAVGEDYNILLVTRRRSKERKRHGDEEGMRRGLARTGGTITSCGLIMAGTFAHADARRPEHAGADRLRPGVGVLLDTFMVRPFLVPAFTLLVMGGEDEAPVETLPFSISRRAG